MKSICLRLVIIFSLILGLSSCNLMDSVYRENKLFVIKNKVSCIFNNESKIVFKGIESFTEKTDSSVHLNWAQVEAVVSYELTYFSALEAPKKLILEKQNSIKISNLSHAQNYDFYINANLSNGKKACGQNVFNVVLDSTPSPITNIQKINSDKNENVKIKILGGSLGDKLNLYKDKECSEVVKFEQLNQGEGFFDVSFNHSNSNQGMMKIYGIVENLKGLKSKCSNGFLIEFDLLKKCPDGYELINYEESQKMKTFCLAKYEMRCSGNLCPAIVANENAVPLSTNLGKPWVDISQDDAKKSCDFLNNLKKENGQYSLINNEQWMSVAREIENVKENWSTGKVDNGVIYKGWSQLANKEMAPDSSNRCLYNDSAGGCLESGDLETRRTLYLRNGHEIWDLAGNVWEWVDWNVESKHKILSSKKTSEFEWVSFKELDINVSENNEMKLNQIMPVYLTPFEEVNGVYYPGSAEKGGAAMRGGRWDDGRHSNIYTLSLFRDSSFKTKGIGFRCVYIPND